MAEQIARRLSAIKAEIHELPPRRFGRVHRIVGMTVEAKGLRAPLGSLCVLYAEGGRELPAQVVGFNDDVTYIMPFGDTTGMQIGAKVLLLGTSDQAWVGEGALGRVLDAEGKPLDGAPLPTDLVPIDLNGAPINPLEKTPINTTMDVGIRAINGLITIGRGQRIGLIAGSGVGKSVLLGMMTKFSNADVIVIGLIGERGREVKEFIDTSLGTEGLGRSVVIASPADHAPLLRLRATLLAHSYAEYFRQKGKHVLLLLDSLTRVAHAQREIGLAVGEPPTSKGYPPSVFSFLPKLIERSGTGGKNEGTITAFYTILAEGDDLDDPVVDIARASLDGQITLSRQLADGGHYPAIDLPASISRLMPVLANEHKQSQALEFKKLWSLYEENKDMLRIGAYQSGSDQELDRAISLRANMANYLTQGMSEHCNLDEATYSLDSLFTNDQTQ